MTPRIWTLALCTVLLAACAGDKNKVRPLNPLDPDLQRQTARLQVAELYRTARASLESGDFSSALEVYRQIEVRHPFTAFATQAQLESVYAHFRAFEPELALSAADRFIRAHPRHEHIAYVHYLRGLINFDRSNADILDLFDMDSAARDPINYKRAFEDFARLVQRFPDSPYAADARQRMIYLKNRIARHEQTIAQYYYKRRAYVAASRRALDIIARFQGTEVIPPVLELLARCYDGLDLAEQAQAVRTVLAASYPDYDGTDEAAAAQEPAEVTDPAPPPAAG